MTPATQEQIEAACLTRSQTGAQRYLASIGLHANETQCKDAISHLIASKQRAPMRVTPIIGDMAPDLSREAQAMSCRVFLRRLLETGHHHISDPARMASALREAGMVPA